MRALWAQLRARLDARRATDDSGTALVLALLIVLMVGTLLGAALDFTRQGLTIVPGERDDRNTSNYIQGAVQGAVNNIRGSSELGREGISCPDFSPDVPAGVSGVSGSTFKVTCNGLSTGGSAGGDDIPRYAIQALGAAPEGIRQVAGNDLLYINGGIYSRGVVSVNGGSQNAMRVNGTLTARGGCTGAITTTDVVGSNCTAGPSSFDTAPDYHPALADSAALQSLISTGTLNDGADPVPTCVGGRVEFQPGYYQETPAALQSLVLPSCSSSVYHFNPGVYYFDYAGVWDLNGTKIIGGTYVNSSFGTSCDHADDASPAPGVQFIFGGASQIFTKSPAGGSTEGMELCGPEKGSSLNGTPQRIVVYALSGRDSLTSPAPTTSTSTFKYTVAPTSSSSSKFLLPGNAQLIDGVLSAAATVADKGDSATLEYQPLATTPPKGSDVTKVGVKVAQTLATDTKATLQLTWPGTFSPVEVDATSCPAGVCDVTSVLAAHDVTWRSLTQLSITYVLEATKKGSSRTSTVDGIELQVTSRPPGLRAITCTTGCRFLQSANNPNVFFHGTVYAPTAGLAVRIHNSGETIFDRGVIVRDLAIDMNSSSKQTTSPFSVPSGTPAGRLVLFRGYVNGVEKVRACVRYTDQAANPDGTVSAYAGYALAVPNWLVMRTPSTSAPTCS